MSPAAKLSAPLSVNVWPGWMVTGTFAPTANVAPDATVKPPGKE